MNNVILLPTAKTILHHYPKKPGIEVIELVYDGISELTKKQRKLLEKRIKVGDQILEALPKDKKRLFDKYVSLQLDDTCLSIDRAIKWTIENEAEIKDVMLGY